MPKTHHILNAASNLLGICLLIIAGLHIGNFARKTLADEFAWAAAAFLSASCLLSYLAIRAGDGAERSEALADKAFLIGMGTLLVAVLVLAIFSVG